MTATITPQEASRRVLEFAHDDRLIQGDWHTERDGKELACMLGAMGNGVRIDAVSKCPADLMPTWVASLVVGLFDGQETSAAVAWAVRFATQMGNERWPSIRWAHVKTEFLIATATQALEAARPVASKESYWAQVELAHRLVVAALRGDGDLSAAWSAAESAARSAAWSAAESAAWSAAESAAWSAAESAAWSAQAATLSDLIDAELVTVPA